MELILLPFLFKGKFKYEWNNLTLSAFITMGQGGSPNKNLINKIGKTQVSLFLFPLNFENRIWLILKISNLNQYHF